MFLAIQATIAQLLPACGVSPQVAAPAADILASAIDPAPEVQPPPPQGMPEPQIDDQEGIMSLRDQKMLGIFQRLSPPRFTGAASKDSMEFLTTCQE